uniref:Uncharacterized protein n=1 Tax=Candidatus Kentrum sp. DK TaxID=2126562 RepID=A0A450T1T6_9GAMM|nr:MAG: hypothetical protein BECKDK2373B_GA0170837_109217 [Candidatus Kentron sp. DK]
MGNFLIKLSSMHRSRVVISITQPLMMYVQSISDFTQQIWDQIAIILEMKNTVIMMLPCINHVLYEPNSDCANCGSIVACYS